MSEKNRLKRYVRVNRARQGKAVCACGTVASSFAAGGPVCARCRDIESRLSYHYAKSHTGVAHPPKDTPP